MIIGDKRMNDVKFTFLVNTRDGYSIMAPKEPLFFDDPVYIVSCTSSLKFHYRIVFLFLQAVIKRSNISFILKCIEQILPALEVGIYNLHH